MFRAVDELPKEQPLDSDWWDDFDLNNPTTATDAKPVKQLDVDLYAYLTEQCTDTAREVFKVWTGCLQTTDRDVRTDWQDRSQNYDAGNWSISTAT